MPPLTCAGKISQQVREAKQFVQGVAWHPQGRQLAAQSSDGYALLA